MGEPKKSRERKGPPVPDEMAGLPERLKRAMRVRGVDQPALARASGVSQGTISKLTRSDSLEGATAVVVARVAIALEVPSGWLLTGDGDVIPRVVAAARSGSEPVVLDERHDQLVPSSRRAGSHETRRERPA